MTLGEAIRQYREEHELSMRDFAKLCGLSNTMISNYERGTSAKTGEPLIPSVGNVIKVAKAMGLELEDIVALCGDDLGAVTLRDEPDYRGPNPRIARLVEIADALPNKELKELVKYAEFLAQRAAQ